MHVALTGIGPFNSGQLKTLGSLLAGNGHSDSTINYLKVRAMKLKPYNYEPY